jgi:glycopeptide antibiotics resistance protein
VSTSAARSIKFFLAIAYTGYLTWLLFFAAFRVGTTTAINLVPFKTIWSMTRYTFLTGNDWWYWCVNVPGNIAAFIPFPFIFQLFRKSTFNFGRALFISACLPATIEILQFLFQAGSCDIDDWMFNFLGMMTGYYFVYRSRKQPAE